MGMSRPRAVERAWQGWRNTCPAPGAQSKRARRVRRAMQQLLGRRYNKSPVAERKSKPMCTRRTDAAVLSKGEYSSMIDPMDPYVQRLHEGSYVKTPTKAHPPSNACWAENLRSAAPLAGKGIVVPPPPWDVYGRCRGVTALAPAQGTPLYASAISLWCNELTVEP